MEGLSYIPDLGNPTNDLQYYDEQFLNIRQHIEPHNFYSFKNRQVLLNCLMELRLTDDHLYDSHTRDYYPSVILEIGVGRKERFLNTSTAVLTGFKSQNVRYIGIDRQDRSYLRKFAIPNLVLLQENTENVFETNPWLDGMEINLLHIDGSHSVNGILTDWQFAKFVVDSGIIVIHDIKAHPGPIELVKAIDRNIYRVREYFLSDPKDFGVAVVYKRENTYDLFYS